MKNSANGNMYEVTAGETWELFDAFLSGNRNALVCVVASNPLGKQARQALESSAAAFGYGPAACAFAILNTKNANGDTASYETDKTSAANKDIENGEATESDGAKLDPQALFLLLEGLDPLCVIAADEDAARMLGAAYRCEMPLDAPSRLFGRSAVAFRSFPRMLDGSHSKQIAWSLLKKLPKFPAR